MISESFQQRNIPSFTSYTQLKKLATHLQENGAGESGSFVVIAKARVPLVKFVDKQTGIRVDLSFDNPSGLHANKTFEVWKAQFPAMPVIVSIIKQFLLMRGLNDVSTGGLGGFSIICLVVSLFQNYPPIQTGDVAPEQHLGHILMEFMRVYGNIFDYERLGISMDPPGYLHKVSSYFTGRCPRDSANTICRAKSRMFTAAPRSSCLLETQTIPPTISLAELRRMFSSSNSFRKLTILYVKGWR